MKVKTAVDVIVLTLVFVIIAASGAAGWAVGEWLGMPAWAGALVGGALFSLIGLSLLGVLCNVVAVALSRRPE